VIDPREVEHLGALAAAGVIGFAGNWIAAIIRTTAGVAWTARRSWPTGITPEPMPMCHSP
jgi:hypothetical protein